MTQNFLCPICMKATTVSNSRRYVGNHIRRNRECEEGHQFHTVEMTMKEFEAIARTKRDIQLTVDSWRTQR